MKAAALIGTLSVSLYNILLLAYTLTPAQTHHVVFEGYEEAKALEKKKKREQAIKKEQP